MTSKESCIFCLENIKSGKHWFFDKNEPPEIQKLNSELTRSVSRSLCQLFEVNEIYASFFSKAPKCLDCLSLILNVDYSLRSLIAIKKQIKYAREALKESFINNYKTCTIINQRTKVAGKKLLSELKKIDQEAKWKRNNAIAKEVNTNNTTNNINIKIPNAKSKISNYEEQNCYNNENNSATEPIEIDSIDLYLANKHEDIIERNSIALVSDHECEDETFVNFDEEEKLSHQILSRSDKLNNEQEDSKLSVHQSNSDNSLDRNELIQNELTISSTANKNETKNRKNETIDHGKEWKKQSLKSKISQVSLNYMCNLTPTCRSNGKCFTSFKELIIHLKEVHDYKSILTPYHCTFCDSQFKILKELEEHETSVHGVEYNCDHCGKKFLKNHLLISHVKREHESRKGLPKCSVCCKIYDTVEEVAEHEILHSSNLLSNSLAFNCVMCSDEFVTAPDLQKHVLTTHETDTFRCEKCPYVFITASCLYHHKKRVHFRKRKFACSECPSKFSSSSLLKQHLRYHSEPTLCCPIEGCCKKYVQKFSLNSHLARAHGQRSKNFKCQICEAMFFTKSDLANHQVYHFEKRPFLCEVCSRSYKSIKHLDTHMRLHSKKELNIKTFNYRKGKLSLKTN